MSFDWFRRGRSPLAATTRAFWRTLRMPDDRTPLEEAAFVVVDTETTGLDPGTAELLSIGSCRIRSLAVEIQSLTEIAVRPSTPSATENVLIHGIGHGRQQLGAGVDEAIATWVRNAMPAMPVAYHALFDATILARHADRTLGIRLPRDWLDPALLLPALLEPASTRITELDHWLSHFGIPCRDRHGAAADAQATAQLFLVILARARRRGIRDISGLRALQHKMLSSIAREGHNGMGA